MADQATLDILIQVREELSGLRKTQDAFREMKKEATSFGDTFKLGAALGLGNFTVENTLGKIRQAVVGTFNAIITANDQLVAEIERANSRIGITGESYQVYSTILRDAGQSADSIFPAFDRLNSTIGDAANGNQQAIDSLARLGLSYTQLRGLKPEEQFQLIARQLGQIADENQRASISSDVLGRGYSQLKPLLEALANNTMVQLKTQTRETAGLVSDELTKAMEKAADRGEQAGERITRAFAGMALQIKESKADFLDFIASLVVPDEAENRQYFEQEAQKLRRAGVVDADNFYQQQLNKLDAQLAERKAKEDAETAKQKAVLAQADAPQPDSAPSRDGKGGEEFSQRLIAYEQALNTAKEQGQALTDRLRSDEELRVVLADRLAEATQRVQEISGNPLADELQKTQAINEQLVLKKELADVEKKIAADLKSQAEEEKRKESDAKRTAETNARLASSKADLELSRGIGQAEGQIAVIQANRFLTEQQKKAAILPLLQTENGLIADRIKLLEDELLLTGDESARQQIQGRIDGLRGQQTGNTIAQGENQQLGVSESIDAGLTSLQSRYEDTGANIASIFTDTISTGVDVAADGFQRLLGNTEYWTSKLGAAGPIIGALTGGIAKMFAQWVAGQLLSAVTGRTAQAAQTAQTAAALPVNTANAAAVSTGTFGASAIVGTIALIAGIAAIAAAFGGFRERGGDVRAGRAYVVGERRPELFVPNQSGRILPSLDALSFASSPARIDSGSSGTAETGGGSGGRFDRRPITVLPLMDRDEVHRLAREAIDETYVLDLINGNMHRVGG